MKILVTMSMLFLLITGLTAQEYKPVINTIQSNELQGLTGSFSYCVKFKILDSLSFTNDVNVNAPRGWQVSISQIPVGNTYSKGDSITAFVSVLYPIDSIPVFVQPIEITHHLNFSTESYSVISMAQIYFTPYSTIEVWNMEDFSNLPRRWYTAENAPFHQRLPIAKNTIPVSNINTEVPVSWHDASRIWENDNPDDFREVYIPGLAYSVLMKPMPEDSVGCSRPRVQ